LIARSRSTRRTTTARTKHGHGTARLRLGAKRLLG